MVACSEGSEGRHLSQQEVVAAKGELSESWGWPRVGSVEAALAVEATNRAERTKTQWTPMVRILDGAWNARPLAHMAEGVRHDLRWSGMPAAMHLRATLEGDPAAAPAVQIVSGVKAGEWASLGRGVCIAGNVD